MMNTQNDLSTTTPSEIIKKIVDDKDDLRESSSHQILCIKNDDDDDQFEAANYRQSEQGKSSLKEVDALTAISPTHPKDKELMTGMAVADRVEEEEESGRERLQRHRAEMAGRVWIPDMWGQEDLLKDWIDCNAFDASLVNTSILSARAALMQQPTTAATSTHVLTRIHNRC